MTRTSYFWGGALVLFGLLLLLSNIGIITVNIWGIFWPLVLIFLGIQILLSISRRGRALPVQQVDLPVNQANQADIRIQHGAGKLSVSAGNIPSNLITGTFQGGVEPAVFQNGNQVQVTLRPPNNLFVDWPFWSYNRGGISWEVCLNQDIPIHLNIETGASEANIDLSQLKVTDFHLGTGASSSYITMPEHAGQTQARIGSGVASVNITIPQGVAARIEIKSGLSGNTINTRRFPKQGAFYESPDFMTATNRVDLLVESGVGSIDIH